VPHGTDLSRPTVHVLNPLPFFLCVLDVNIKIYQNNTIIIIIYICVCSRCYWIEICFLVMLHTFMCILSLFIIIRCNYASQSLNTVFAWVLSHSRPCQNQHHNMAMQIPESVELGGANICTLKLQQDPTFLV